VSVAGADSHLARLKGLLGRLRLKAAGGIWVIPSLGVPTIGVLVPLALLYLDSNRRVIHTIESLGSFRIGPIRKQCSSVLELPPRPLYSSPPQVGDVFLICPPVEMQA